MAAIAKTVSPMIAEDIAAAKAAGVEEVPPMPVGNPLKLKKAATELFAEEGLEPTDISFLQVAIGKLLSLAVKTRKVPTKETETYTGKDGTEKTRKVKVEAKVIQLTLDYDEFFAAVTDAPSDYRITDASIPTDGIASRVVLPKAKKAKAAKAAKAAAPAPTTPAKKAASTPDAPKKAKAAKPKAPKAPKAPAMPVLTEEQLASLLKEQPPLAPKAQVRTMKKYLEALGVEEKDFKQARADWVAYRADHEPAAPAALLDDAKLEHLRVLDIGPKPQVRNPKLVEALKSWGIAEADYKKATMEYKAWAKENGVESAKGSKTSSPKVKPAAAPAAPAAIRTPTATNPFEGSDDEEEDDGTPMSEAGMEDEAHDTALEAIGDAADLDAFA